MNRPIPIRHRCAALLLAAPALLPVAGCSTAPARPEPLPTPAQSLAAGAHAESRGNLQGALVEYARAASADPKNAEAHYRAARVQAALGNATTAREGLQRALALHNDHPGAQESLGLLELDAGRRDAARALLVRAVAAEPQRWQAWNGLGVIADLEGRFDVAARNYYDKALALQPQRPALLNNFGYSKYLAGDLTGAQELFERALRADSAYAPARANLGLVHARRGDLPRAVQTFERLMNPAQARYAAAYVCQMDGKLDEAEQLLRGAIDRSPSYFAAAQDALARVTQEREAKR